MAGALHRSNATILIASAFIVLFVVLDLAVLWPAKVSLIALGEAYGSASADARMALATAAGYPSAVLDSDLVAVYSVLTIGIGIGIVGLIMWRAGLGRATAVAGVATGGLAIASVVEAVTTGNFPVLVVGASLLTIVWLVLIARFLLWSPGIGIARIG